jgi:hypothetical protein
MRAEFFINSPAWKQLMKDWRSQVEVDATETERPSCTC